MTRAIVVGAVLAVVAIVGLGILSPALAQNVNINIGTPPPTVVVAPPAPVVIEQRVPVYYYDGRYYRYYDRGWFIAERHEGPWFIVPVERVPQRVLAIPVAYKKIPPGHAKKLGPPEWARDDRDDDREHGKKGHGKKGKD